MQPKKLNIIAYFDQAVGPEFDNYLKVASLLRDDCVFWFGTGEAFRSEVARGNRLEFKPLNVSFFTSLIYKKI